MTTKKTTTSTKETTVNALQVTHCQVLILREPIGKIKATVRIILNDALQMTALRIVDGAAGLFVAYPNDPAYRGEDYRSLFYPITKELREHIEEVVLCEYHKIANP